MANVTPGFTFTSTTPISATALNLLGQPTVAIGSGEVGTTTLASNISISGLTIAADTPFIGSASTETYSAAITLTISTSKGNTRLITCTNATNFSVTPSAGGTAGQEMTIIFLTNGTGGNVVTYASPFKSTGTHTLTGASSYFTSTFRSNGTYWCEISRTAALS
jgi:hypothetical protein